MAVSYIGRIITYLLYNFIVIEIDIVIINMGREKCIYIIEILQCTQYKNYYYY